MLVPGLGCQSMDGKMPQPGKAEGERATPVTHRGSWQVPARAALGREVLEGPVIIVCLRDRKFSPKSKQKSLLLPLHALHAPVPPGTDKIQLLKLCFIQKSVPDMSSHILT